MPINVDIKQLDGDGIEATLMRHHAGWYKTCRLKFNQTKLERLQKRTKEKISSVVNTHSSHTSIDLKDDKCFLCERPAGSLQIANWGWRRLIQAGNLFGAQFQKHLCIP